MKVYIAWHDESGCCHLDPPIGVFSTFELAREAIVTARASRRARHSVHIPNAAVAIMEVDLDVTHLGEDLWPTLLELTGDNLPSEPERP